MRDSRGVEKSFLKPGDLLLVRGSTWIDKIIQIITRSSYSHVAGIVKSDEVIDILPFKRTGFKKLLSYSGRADVFVCKDLTYRQRKKILFYVLRKIGTKYNYKLLLWEASRYLLDWKWPCKVRSTCLCSTLWVEAYREAGIDLCPDILYPSPGDLEHSQCLAKVKSY